MCLIIAVVCASGMFADSFSVGALDSLGDILVSALQSKWLKAILAVALVIEFGIAAWGQSKGASEMVSGAIKWMFATGGMLGATGIANFIFKNITPEDLAFNMTQFFSYYG